MVNAIISFFVNNFLETILTILVASMIKQMVDQIGQNRTELIQDAIVTAMYWAEQQFGVGAGPLKWEKAWRKIRELLETQNIKLTQKEEERAIITMESLVPEINQTTYSVLPEKEIEKREIRSNINQEWIEYLRKKYVEDTKKEDEKSE